MKVLFQKIHPEAVLPTYAHAGDAGLDVTSVEEIVIPARGRGMVHTGLRMILPSGTEAQVRPRSGLAFRHGVTILNAPGTIDEGYRGELCILLMNISEVDFKVEKGMRIAQLVIAPVLQVETEETGSVDETVRGTGGFGSTGLI